MKGAAAVIAAGSAFTGCALAGLVLGIALDRYLHQTFYIVVGLFAGVFLGGYAGIRLLLQALSR